MKNILAIPFLFVLMSVCSSPSIAQTGWEWGIRSYTPSGAGGFGNEGYTVTTDRAGNVFQASINGGHHFISYDTFSVPNNGAQGQLILSKTDSSGHVKWVRYADSAYAMEPGSVCTDAAGNLYYFGGFFMGNFAIDTFVLKNPISSQFMGMLMKVSPTGQILWAKDVSAFLPSVFYNPGGMGIDDSGYLYICESYDTSKTKIGSTTLINKDPSGATCDIFLAKYDSSGNVRWAKNISGNKDDLCTGMSVTPLGNIYFCGKFTSDTLSSGSVKLVNSAGSGTQNSFLAKFDHNGNPVFIKETNLHLHSNAIGTDIYDNAYVTGYFDAPVVVGPDTIINDAPSSDIFLAKYSPTGSPVWARSAGGFWDEKSQSIAVDRCGKIWVQGQLGYSGGSFSGYTMNFSGHTLTQPPGASSDPIFMAEYDTSGNYLAALALPSGGDDFCSIAVDNFGNFFVGGDYWQTTLYLGRDTLLQNGSQEELYVAKYKYDTTVCDCFFAPVAGYTHTGTSAVTFTYTGSATYDSVRWTFGDGTSSTTLNPTHGYSMGLYIACVTIYSRCDPDGYSTYCDTIRVPEGVPNVINAGNITIFPNPVSSDCTIQTDQPFPLNATADLYDLSGRFIESYPLAGLSTTISVAGLPSGIYECRIGTGNGYIVKKLAVY